MNFDVFMNVEFRYKELLLYNCCTAERNIMISPYSVFANARAALEVLCKGLIRENGIEEKKAEDGKVYLATKVETCIENDLFTDKDSADEIRKGGNNALHANKSAQGIHVLNAENIDKATFVVECLYKILSEVFHNTEEFDIKKIPFGFYDVVRAVPKATNEVIQGDYNYFTRDPKGNYYYFQVFPRKNNEQTDSVLGQRGVLMGNKIKADKSRKSYLLHVHYPSDLLAEADRDYIAYAVYSDSMLLSEIREELSEKQTVQIAIDLLCVLQELQNIGEGVHLRNIQPGNVIITPSGDDYMASIVNMETAKIVGYDATVYGSMKDWVAENVYYPEEVRRTSDTQDVAWEKVDIYSIAVVMLYCRARDLVDGSIDTDRLFDYFSEEVAEILCEIFGSSINEVDDVYTIREKLENALKEL